MPKFNNCVLNFNSSAIKLPASSKLSPRLLPDLVTSKKDCKTWVVATLPRVLNTWALFNIMSVAASVLIPSSLSDAICFTVPPSNAKPDWLREFNDPPNFIKLAVIVVRAVPKTINARPTDLSITVPMVPAIDSPIRSPMPSRELETSFRSSL